MEGKHTPVATPVVLNALLEHARHPPGPLADMVFPL